MKALICSLIATAIVVKIYDKYFPTNSINDCELKELVRSVDIIANMICSKPVTDTQLAQIMKCSEMPKAFKQRVNYKLKTCLKLDSLVEKDFPKLFINYVCNKETKECGLQIEKDFLLRATPEEVMTDRKSAGQFFNCLKKNAFKDFKDEL